VLFGALVRVLSAARRKTWKRHEGLVDTGSFSSCLTFQRSARSLMHAVEKRTCPKEEVLFAELQIR
jgi:hypothetical protein